MIPPDSQPAKVPAVFRIKSKKNVKGTISELRSPKVPLTRPLLGHRLKTGEKVPGF